MTERGSAWMYTYHKQEGDDLDILRNIFLREKIKYLIANIEICPTTGREHIQGYVVFNEKQSMKQVKEELNIGVRYNLERRQGTHEQAKIYCSKEESRKPGTLPLEYGSYNEGRGKRNDISLIKEIVKTGGSLRSVLEVATSYQSVRMAEIYLKYFETPRNEKPLIKWFWGDTGTGKTKRAYEESDPLERYVTMGTGKWWDGYDAHKHVIFDDFRGDFSTFHMLLRLLDRYECRVECKGGSRQFKPTHIWITSCYPPNRIYQTIENVGQLLRRIDEIVEFRDEKCPLSTLTNNPIEIEIDDDFS